jgi:hypothetical protein
VTAEAPLLVRCRCGADYRLKRDLEPGEVRPLPCGHGTLSFRVGVGHVVEATALLKAARGGCPDAQPTRFASQCAGDPVTGIVGRRRGGWIIATEGGALWHMRSAGLLDGKAERIESPSLGLRYLVARGLVRQRTHVEIHAKWMTRRTLPCAWDLLADWVAERT